MPHAEIFHGAPHGADRHARRRHGVQFYGSDAELLEVIAQVIASGWVTGAPALVIATEAHRAALVDRLGRSGVKVGAAEAAGLLTLLDADETLARFMRGGAPDAALFRAEIEPLLERAAARSSGAPVRAYGEMVDLLWQRGQTEAALQLEELWNDLQIEHAFTLQCGYRLDSGYGDGDVRRIVATHDHILAGDVDQRDRLLQVTGAIAEAVGPDQVYQAVVDQVTVSLGAITGGLWRLDDGGSTVRLVRSVGYSERARAYDAVPLDAAARVPVLDAIRDGRPIWTTSREELAARYPHLTATLPSDASYQIACLPITVGGQPVGALAFTFEAATLVDEDARSFLLLVARYCSQALERLHLLEANQRGRQRAELLYGLARALIEARTIADVHEAALAAIATALDAPRAAVLTCDAGGAMRFAAWRGLSDAYRSAVDGHSPWPRDAADPQPVLVADAAADPAMAAYQEAFRAEGIGALAFFPLVAGGRLLGKFMVYYGAPRALSADEVEVADAIANHLGAAIERFDAVAELERTVRFNEVFTAILGHDLRNPLAAIMAATQLLLSRTDDERTSRPLSRILNSGQRMARMIGQLLDFTRVRVGPGIPLEPSATDLAPVVRQVVDELAAAREGAEIAVTAAGDLAGQWDPDRLSQVFSNLVGNALQHGEGGLRVELDGAAAEQVVVEIHNHGVIAEDRLPRLFEPMGGAEHRSERTHGLGLGLFISRQIIRAHGGDVTVRSSADEGTTFTVRLPRATAGG